LEFTRVNCANGRDAPGCAGICAWADLNTEAEMAFSSEGEETFSSVREETFVCLPVIPATQISSEPSPEEGRRLIRDFLRVQRPELREEIFNFVAKILKIQEEDKL
jgi:hypothetical protein